MPFSPPTLEDVLTSSLSKYITYVANDCGWSGFVTEILTVMIPWMDNFADEYWKAAKIEINTLEGMGTYLDNKMKMLLMDHGSTNTSNFQME